MSATFGNSERFAQHCLALIVFISNSSLAVIPFQRKQSKAADDNIVIMSSLLLKLWTKIRFQHDLRYPAFLIII